MMNFRLDWLPSSPLRDEEIYGAGVAIKEEASEGVTEETCVEIKEESLDYADEARDEVSEATTEHGFPFYKDLKHEDFESDSSNVIEDSNDALPAAPFVAEAIGPKGSSDEDQAAHREGHEELRNYDKKKKRFVCKVCGKNFLYKSYLTKHMIVHTKEKLYSCDICEKTYSRKHDLVMHMRIHTKEKLYSCEVCEKAFSRKQDLVKHIRVHTKEKPHRCKVCEKAFSQKQHLVTHMRIHTKEKPYSCEVCEKAFPRKQSLVLHMRIHTKEKPYSCDVCKKAFSWKPNLLRHMRAHATQTSCL
ncbi:gastrula zinc finger protein XlCGF8.2DB-like [Penaeus japonicus]|uniref:gastrula zinc finger protein XlCGF8.2DB-like n=1 Tax=Penaeus japonicus TaxID=27405 RepID=UPI001C70F5E4|nr:gastrula zinc finger protein XlCGF8.2DB-like [Penaeus japonicus]